MKTDEHLKLKKSSSHESEGFINTSRAQTIKEEPVNNIQAKVEEQRRLINQYEAWIGGLFELLDNTKYSEYSSQIIKGIEKIEPLYIENDELKTVYQIECMKKEELKKLIINKKVTLLKRKEEIKNHNLIEKVQLIDSISLLSDDLEFLSEKNSNFKLNKLNNITIDLQAQLNHLKSENSNLKNRIKQDSNSPRKKLRFNNERKTRFHSVNGRKPTRNYMKNVFACFSRDISPKNENCLIFSLKK